MAWVWLNGFRVFSGCGDRWIYWGRTELADGSETVKVLSLGGRCRWEWEFRRSSVRGVDSVSGDARC
jgi:hypothetical protein